MTATKIEMLRWLESEFNGCTASQRDAAKMKMDETNPDVFADYGVCLDTIGSIIAVVKRSDKDG